MGEHSEHHGRHGHGSGEGCCGPASCGPSTGFRRHFPTREERIAWLEEYLKDLQAETKAVAERIAELKAAA